MRIHALLPAIGVIVALSCPTPIQAADDGSRFAAIWERTSGPSFVARHGLTSQQYQQEFDRLTGQGFRLSLVDGFNVGGQDRYAAIFEQAPGPAFVARHGLTSQQYQQEFDRLTGQGFCLTDVSGYSVGNEPRFAAIWVQKNCPPFVARHGLTSQQYQQEFDRLVGQGFRLSWVSGYKVGGQDQFAAIWERTSGPEFVARHGMTSDGYQQEFDRLVGQGFRLKLVSGY